MLEIILFWGIWLVIPVMFEIGIGLISGVALLYKKIFIEGEKKLRFYPTVSVLIPVYKSEATIEKCIKSVINQNYERAKIRIYLLNNGPVDDSYRIFKEIERQYPLVKMWWLNTKAGKSKALNVGLLKSSSKYIINIDSDGWLAKNSIRNMIYEFESNRDIAALTGVILTEPALIEKTEKLWLRLIHKCELIEYAESFLIGRNFKSMSSSIYTLAGAFSGVRRKAVTKTHLYNHETVGEDTHMSFQVKRATVGAVKLCTSSFFYVDPIDSLDHLYTQRQRWQKGQLEVANLFSKDHLGWCHNFFNKLPLRLLIYDHTLVFPRLIWAFGLVYLYLRGYPFKLLFISNLLLYGLYVFNGFIYFGVYSMFLTTQQEVSSYFKKNAYMIFFLPFYRILTYVIRMAGIINSLTIESEWTTTSLSEEIALMKQYFNKRYQDIIQPFILWFEKKIIK